MAPPLALNVVVLPAHIVASAPALIVGDELTTMVVVAVVDELQPLPGLLTVSE